MIRWVIYLPLYAIAQVLVYAFTWAMPAFCRMEYGPIDNANGFANEPRLPTWLNYCNTYDNSLWGDDNWKKSRDASVYWSMVAWLYRNSFYTGKLKLFGMPVQIAGRIQSGNPNINHHTNTFGSLRINQPNGAWQYKCVKPFLGRILILNMGWLLDDASQYRALFMLSPRWKKP